MASATATLASSPTTALTLANVLYEKKVAIAYVTVNRPKVLNALDTPTWKDMRTAFEDAQNDVTVRGVILTGAGDKAFIAGPTSANSRTRVRLTPNGRAASDRECSTSSRISASR
jgi:enoyl-CoA hydratase/carnithine racemase